jgi:hypothetical protein
MHNNKVDLNFRDERICANVCKSMNVIRLKNTTRGKNHIIISNDQITGRKSLGQILALLHYKSSGENLE